MVQEFDAQIKRLPESKQFISSVMRHIFADEMVIAFTWRRDGHPDDGIVTHLNRRPIFPYLVNAIKEARPGLKRNIRDALSQYIRSLKHHRQTYTPQRPTAAGRVARDDPATSTPARVVPDLDDISTADSSSHE